MSPLSGVAVAARRFLVRRPWVYWLLVAAAALGAAASMFERSARVDEARESWGRTEQVWVATADLAPGDQLAAERREVPMAVVTGDVVDEVAGLVARQHVGAGEIVHRSDVVAPGGPQAITPAGWLVVPIIESPRSGASIGDRAQAVSDGVVISDDVVVVGHHDDVTLVAVPADVASLLPVAAGEGRLTLLLVP